MSLEADVAAARLKDRAIVAEIGLRIDAARQYGFIEGGPDYDLDACEAAIEEAKAAGIEWTESDITRRLRVDA